MRRLSPIPSVRSGRSAPHQSLFVVRRQAVEVSRGSHGKRYPQDLRHFGAKYRWPFYRWYGICDHSPLVVTCAHVVSACDAGLWETVHLVFYTDRLTTHYRPAKVIDLYRDQNVAFLQLAAPLPHWVSAFPTLVSGAKRAE